MSRKRNNESMFNSNTDFSTVSDEKLNRVVDNIQEMTYRPRKKWSEKTREEKEEIARSYFEDSDTVMTFF